MSFHHTPVFAATSWRPGPGFCVGAQISTLPPCTCAVQFIGSSVACAKKWIGIGRFDHAAAGLRAAVTSPSWRRIVLAALRPELGRLARKAVATLVGGRALVPVHLELFPRLFGAPPVIGDDGDAGHQPVQDPLPPSTTKAWRTPGSVLMASMIGADHLAAEDRAFLEHRIKHARHD